jgi:hypothetical protein
MHALCCVCVWFRLFHLRRGPLLSPILQHIDDVDCVRSIFLHAPVQDCLRLLVPPLLSFNADAAFEELPLDTLCLQSNRILLLDHHTHVMIWSGSRMTRPEYDVFREACMARVAAATATRLPAPKVLVFKVSVVSALRRAFQSRCAHASTHLLLFDVRRARRRAHRKRVT